MADNLTAPATGAILAADDVGGVMYPRCKISFGADGAATDVSPGAGLPVAILGNVPVTGTFWQATQPISAAALPLPAGAATEATLAAASAKLPASLGAKTAAASLSITFASDLALPAGENHIGQIGGYASNPSANFSRPNNTTAYAIGQLVANHATAASVVAGQLTAARKAAGSFSIQGLKLHKSGATITNAAFRVHFFRAAPTVANGDGGAYVPTGVANYLGYFDVTIDQVFGDGAAGFSAATAAPRYIKLAAGTDIYFLIEARAAYTPASGETFTVTPEIVLG